MSKPLTRIGGALLFFIVTHLFFVVSKWRIAILLSLSPFLKTGTFDPETDLPRGMLIKKFIDTFIEKGTRVFKISEILGNRNDVNAKLFSKELFVLTGFANIPSETRSMEDEDSIEFFLHRLINHPLKIVSLGR